MYRLPEDLRWVFQQPLGPIIEDMEQLELSMRGVRGFVTVGDVVSKTMIQMGRSPKVAVVDYHTQRGDVDPELRRFFSTFGDRVVRVPNPAATITDEAEAAMRDALKFDGSTRLEVEGEEDMLGLLPMAYGEDGTIVLYGMPNRGVVRVPVENDVRMRALQLLERMRAE